MAENLLVAGPMYNGSRGMRRIGIATEDSADNVEMVLGDVPDVPMTASEIIDRPTVGVSEPCHSTNLMDRTINVLTGNHIWNEHNMPSYFTSAFPTIFPWGTGIKFDIPRSWNLRSGFNYFFGTHRGTDPT